ncbi:MAG: DNA repair protein RadA [Alphaproteobacteria bacterium]|nr:DNA repair protein RadA [Alphaproteobacteria bacterium]
MPKVTAKRYVCRECGSAHSVWSGRCNDCGNWNSLDESDSNLGHFSKNLEPRKKSFKNSGMIVRKLSDDITPARFTPVGIAEFDRVLGGGIVAGATVLIGGDPGIGKSTLLLQAASLCSQHSKVLYISGEESVEQILLRAERLSEQSQHLNVATETSVEAIVDALATLKPDFVVIDSIQTMYLAGIEASPGTVSQVRASSHLLMSAAKKYGFSLVLIGHVTKEGAIAGPRVLEHMVDTVLYFEGERSQHFRLLRAVKNRFGACNEIGVFEMSSNGLREIANPSALFLADREEAISGTCVVPALEGTRPILIEIQSLVAQTHFASPRRAVIGWDQQRLAMIIAVLEKRFGYNFAEQDVYLNVTGGYRLQEPAADLAVVIALISSLGNYDVPINLAAFGEVGLSGEVRAVPQPDIRLREAVKLGFQEAILPKQGTQNSDKHGLHCTLCNDLTPLIRRFPPPLGAKNAAKFSTHSSAA